MKLSDDYQRAPFPLNGYEHLGYLSSAPPDRSIGLACTKCYVRWIGCADANECPRCGSTDDYDSQMRASGFYGGAL